MRIPLPERVSLPKVLIFAGVLALVQLLEHTTLLYTLLVFCFFLLSAFTFNVAGGFTRPSGAYIFYFFLLVVGIGTVVKAVVGEPAQSRLAAPMLMMSVYLASMLGMLIAAYLSRKFAQSRDGIAGLLGAAKIDYSQASFGCLIVFVSLYAFSAFAPANSRSVVTALAQLNQFLPLCIMFGTIGAVKDSDGRRSTTPITLCAMVYQTVSFGILGFSKQGVFTPVACWLIAVAWSGYRLRGVHVLTLLLFFYYAQTVLTPLSQVGRNYVRTGTLTERKQIAMKYLTNRTLLNRELKERELPDAFFYYGKSEGIFDRLTMMPNDADLMRFTAQGHVFGYLPVLYYFLNWVPHVVDPNKLAGVKTFGGNAYAHEMGYLAEEDSTTGISYSPAAEAFHLDEWRGVLVLLPIVLILLFVTTDALCGDLRRQPWGLLPTLTFAHIAPEGLLGASIWWTFYGSIATIFAIVTVAYVAPIFAALFESGHGGRRPAGHLIPV